MSNRPRFVQSEGMAQSHTLTFSFIDGLRFFYFNPDSPSFATRGLWLFVCNKEICNPTITYYGFLFTKLSFCVENAQPFSPRYKRGEVVMCENLRIICVICVLFSFETALPFVRWKRSDSPSFATRGFWLFVYNKEICNPSMIH